MFGGRAISRAILKLVYRFGIPKWDPQTLESVKISSYENKQIAIVRFHWAIRAMSWAI